MYTILQFEFLAKLHLSNSFKFIKIVSKAICHMKITRAQKID